MSDDDATKHTDTAGPGSARQPDGSRFPPGETEIVPWAEGQVGRGYQDSAPTRAVRPGPPAGPGDGPPTVRVRRSLLIWLLSLLVIAALAVAALVLYRPSPSAPKASPPTPSASVTGPGISPTDSSPAPSPGSGSGSAGGSSPAATPSPTASTAPAVAPGAAGTNLSALNPVQSFAVASITNGPQQIGSTTYQNSVRFTCETQSGTNANIVYDVAGDKFLTATIGVPSNATNAAGNTITLTFFKDGSTDQLGKAVTVALDRPHSVHLNLLGASQLEIACAALNTASQDRVTMDVALGNATAGS